MTQSTIALTLGTVAIRQQDGLYCLNDLHKAAGAESNQQPAFFLRNDQTQALLKEIEATGTPAIKTREGRNGGTYAPREVVIAYAAWINAAFHLKVIRVFLDAVAPAQQAIAYSVAPGQTLNASQADTLRQMLAGNAARLPKAQQGAFMMQGWSKLKAHFKTEYRHIPAQEFDEALSILARHIVDWMPPERVALPAPAPAPARRMVELPTGKIIVDARKLAAIWVDLGKLRKRLDGLGVLDSDLPPSWWDENAISG